MQLVAIQECLKQAMATVSSHKFRSLLTVLGVIVGTTTTIAVTSIISGMNVRVTEMVERFGTNIAFISKWNGGPNFNGSNREEELRKELTLEDGQAIKQLPHVESAVACLGAWPGGPDAPVIKYRTNESKQSVVRGGEASFFDARSMVLAKGRLFGESEDLHSAPVAVIGFDLAEALFPGLEPVDKEITINGHLYRVIGVLEKSSARGLFGGNNNWEDNAAIIPLNSFSRMYPQEKDYVIVAKAKSGHLDKMVDEITEVLRRRRKVPFNEPDNFGISTAQSNIDGFNKISEVLGWMVIPISAVGLLVGGIGVLNIMLVSVTERTKEIGIRRALGARRFDIILQFLIEAMSLTGLGGVMGILVGLFISWFLNTFVPSVPSFVSVFWIMVGFLVAVSVGLISGLWPAIKAAYVDPVVALRYE